MPKKNNNNNRKKGRSVDPNDETSSPGDKNNGNSPKKGK